MAHRCVVLDRKTKVFENFTQKDAKCTKARMEEDKTAVDWTKIAKIC